LKKSRKTLEGHLQGHLKGNCKHIWLGEPARWWWGNRRGRITGCRLRYWV